MKTVKVIEEHDDEGLAALAGARVTLFGMNYIYAGTLAAFDDEQVKLVDAAIVYETGAFSNPQWKDAQKLPHPIYVRLAAVEAYGRVKE